MLLCAKGVCDCTKILFKSAAWISPLAGRAPWSFRTSGWWQQKILPSILSTHNDNWRSKDFLALHIFYSSIQNMSSFDVLLKDISLNLVGQRYTSFCTDDFIVLGEYFTLSLIPLPINRHLKMIRHLCYHFK